jgi:hypothetical protein
MPSGVYDRAEAHNKKQSERAKKRWENPEARKKQSEAQKKYFEDPEARKKQSEAQKKYFENPEARKRNSEAQNKRWENPEARKKQSERAKKQFEDPEARKKQSEALKIAKGTPEARKRNSEAQRIRFEDPEAREKCSEVIIEYWKDPEARIQQSMHKQGIDNYDDWNGYSTPLSNQIRHLKQYKKLTKYIIERDNNKDWITGEECIYPDVHHLKEMRDIIKDNAIKTIEDAINCKELWDAENLITLEHYNHICIFHPYLPMIGDRVKYY